MEVSAEELDALRYVFAAASSATDIALHLSAHRTQAKVRGCGCNDDADCPEADQLAWDELKAQYKMWQAVDKARPLVSQIAAV